MVLIPFRAKVMLAQRPVSHIAGPFTDFILSAAELAILLMLALWLAALAASPRRLRFGPAYVWIPLAGLTVAGWASVPFSLDLPLSVYHAIRLVALFWFYVFIVNEIRSVGWVLIPVGLQVLIQSLVALAQLILQRSIGLQWMGEAHLDPAYQGANIVVADGARLLRTSGLTDHPNILGGCLAFGLILLLAAYLYGARRAAFPVLLVGGAALLSTFSRSSWLALLSGGGLLVAIGLIRNRQSLWKRLLSLGLAGAVLVCAFAAAYPQFFGVRLNAGNSFSTPSEEQQSIGERILLMEYHASIFAHHPLLGVGLGAAPLALKTYEPGFTLDAEPPHLAVLNAAVETGIVGTLFYLALILMPFIIYFTRRESLLSDPRATASIALLVGIAVVGLFDHYTWELGPGKLWQWLAWGLWAAVATPVLAPVQSLEPSEIDAAPSH